ncbi:hypothetical protein SBRCBS47491_010051 [Sporothrix bragantina]|uniref:G-patch domain-containing protein n=1 Tax=Sporothrix bragantina TaxID=671064 RepID=A0ABP0CZP9_9PEZI
MDASGLLKKQGWRGLGHTLHPSDDSTGLARPLLLSRKDDKQGLGSESVHQKAAATDQWWLDAFDQQLKSLATPGGGSTANNSGRATPTRLELLSGNKGYNKYRGAYGLYASFVRGGMIEGTMDDITDTSATATSTNTSTSVSETSTAKTTPERESGADTAKKDKKRKRSDEGEDGKRSKREKKDKSMRKEGSLASDSKGEKRAQKDEAKKLKKEEKKAKQREEKAQEKAAKKAAKKEARAAEKVAERAAKKAVKKEEKALKKAEEKAQRKADKKALKREA